MTGAGDRRLGRGGVALGCRCMISVSLERPLANVRIHMLGKLT